MKLMLGIDTGGTYTDAVLIDETARVVATAKAPTTHHDLAIGIDGALSAVLREPGITPDLVALVSLSTTLATNAIVEGQGDPACLVTVGFGDTELARIMGPGPDIGRGWLDGDRLRPLGDDRADFLAAIDGGHDALGHELKPLDLDSLQEILGTVGDRVSAFAVSSQFSVRNATHELGVREVIVEATGRPVTCGHELSGRLDGPRRARTALLNARLIGVVGRLRGAVDDSLAGRGIRAPVMMVRGDGSVAAAAFAAGRPIETVLSGPAASVVGARHLAGVTSGLVVDIGGTTTDVALVRDGEPVLATEGAAIAGHRTMVEAVEVRTHGLGGDSEVRIEAKPAVVRSPGHEPSAGEVLRLGPSRAVPLCRLAVELPELRDQLARQLADPGPITGQGRLLMITGVRGAVALDDREQQVLDRLADGPRPETEVTPSSRVRLAAERLRRRGLVRVVTFTPTDAACVLGRLPELDREAATLGAELMARQRTESGRPVAPDGVAFARLVETVLIERSVDALLESALDVDGLGEPDTEPAKGGPLGGAVASAIVRAALARHSGATSLQISLTDPVTAVGASAAAYYPRVAEVLGTDVVVPEHAEVANAVGAAVGRVRIRRTLTVSRPRAGQFQLHHGDQPLFAGVDQARDEGRRLLSDEVRALAVEAGAAEPVVTVEWRERSATVNGKQILIEGTIMATATGRPDLG